MSRKGWDQNSCKCPYGKDLPVLLERCRLSTVSRKRSQDSRRLISDELFRLGPCQACSRREVGPFSVVSHGSRILRLNGPWRSSFQGAARSYNGKSGMWFQWLVVLGVASGYDEVVWLSGRGWIGVVPGCVRGLSCPDKRGCFCAFLLFLLGRPIKG